MEVNTRSVVDPLHEAPAKPYRALHVLTVKVSPALTVMPQVATFLVADAVFETLNDPQKKAPVGSDVGLAEGIAVGAVGFNVGRADGYLGGIVGPAVGRVVGTGEGRAVVGRSVGMLLGAAVG